MTKQIFIYRKKEAGVQKEVTLFRREFYVSAEQICRESVIAITADTRYLLYLNGRYVCRGPESGDAWRKYYDVVDAAPFLREGMNCIGVKVIHYPMGDEGLRQFELGPTGLVRSPYGGLCVFSLSGKAVPGTDAEWKWKSDASYGFKASLLARQAGDMEFIQAGAGEEGWTETGYDESRWQNAAVIQETTDCAPASAYGVLQNWMLQPRDIPMLEEKEIEAKSIRSVGGGVDFGGLLRGCPAVVPAGTEAACELDMGKMVTAYVRTDFMKGGQGRAEYLYSECYYHEREGSLTKIQRDDAVDGVLAGETDELRLGDGPFVYEPFEYRAFRYLRLTVRAGEQDVVLKRITFRRTGYPFYPQADFEAEDPVLQRIWKVSLQTLRCCMQDTYIDCPYYERLQYGMDAMIEALHTYPVLGDDRLARKTFLDLAGTQMPDGMIYCNAPSNDRHVIPGFGIYYIDMLYDHFRYFGDKSLVEQYWAVCAGILGFFHRNLDGETGVVSGNGYWEFADWTREWNPYLGVPADKGQGERQYLYTLMYAYGLLRMAQLTEAVYGAEAGRQWRARHGQVTEIINRIVWDPRQGYYRTSDRAVRCSQHAQVWAVLSECIRGKAAKELLRRMQGDASLVRCSYSMKHYYHRALDRAGLETGRKEMWEEYEALLKTGSTTWPEDPVSARSDCHGWSTTPIYEICHNLLGVRPGEPGFGRIVIAPVQWEAGSLKGTVWTPQGCVRVERHVETGEGFRRAVVSFAMERETEVTVRIADREILSGRFRQGECSAIL